MPQNNQNSNDTDDTEKPQIKKKRIFCTHCGSKNLAFTEDETYCKECGLVLQSVPSITHYPYGYIIGNKRQMYTY